MFKINQELTSHPVGNGEWLGESSALEALSLQSVTKIMNETIHVKLTKRDTPKEMKLAGP